MNGANYIEPVKLVPTKSDQELANELRAEIVECSKPYLAAITKAHRLGFTIVMGMSPNAFNEVVIQQLTISKQF